MKSISVQEAGRKGGLKGGKSKSKAKLKAIRENIKKAHKALKLKRQNETHNQKKLNRKISQ